MKQTLSVILCCLIFTSCAKLDTDKKRMSYAVGQQIATNLKQGALDLDPEVVSKSLRDGLAGKSPALTKEQMDAAITLLQQQNNEKEQKLAIEQEKKSLEFLQKNSARKGVQALPNGLQYEVVKVGNAKGRVPGVDDEVVFNFKGSLFSGELFDSSEKEKKPTTAKLNTLFLGLQLGILHMHEGDTYRFFVPPSLAYGNSARPGVPAGSTVILEVELLKVKPAQK